VREGRNARALALDVLAIALPLVAGIASQVAVNTYRWGTAFALPMTAQQAIMETRSGSESQASC
jgi:hypothetical protein